MLQTTAKTHAMRALIDLRKKILAGDYPGGTRLFEVALAEDMGISRTPVREAMSRLAEEGLLDRARGGGFIVRTFGFADVVDAIELRGVLEGTAARLAAERGVAPDALARIRDTVSRLDKCFGETPDDVDFDAYSELNARFHSELAGLAGSEIIRREVERAARLPFASPSAFSPSTAGIAAFRRSLATAQEQHKAILSAIVAREGARAEAIAREHARVARRNLEYVMGEGRSLIARVPGLALVKNA
ncbi:GntR family transcriptional regulator [Mesorhizobium microcysteis]|uniref:GntR family transcriptional regulator n=1 Tax=Neoaquamicrobium microcysteis TaxID=2682781 RepID=A0A5D4GQF3_9HYPH|nr:GntR family transcriptional regulator [Mesorhizobium microcysteis]TYR29565.1 GntR family transcriptional regulator [Mesorhizobium microcysteis]